MRYLANITSIMGHFGRIALDDGELSFVVGFHITNWLQIVEGITSSTEVWTTTSPSKQTLMYIDMASIVYSGF